MLPLEGAGNLEMAGPPEGVANLERAGPLVEGAGLEWAYIEEEVRSLPVEGEGHSRPEGAGHSLEWVQDSLDFAGDNLEGVEHNLLEGVEHSLEEAVHSLEEVEHSLLEGVEDSLEEEEAVEPKIKNI